MDTEKRENMREVIEWIICIVVAVVLALLVRHFIGTPTVVRQGSMETTLLQGDRLILNRWAITTHQEIKRGDIITFEAPSIESLDFNKDNPVAIYNNEPKGILGKFSYYVLEFNKTSYIKRVIAVEGDKILITEDGKVYLNEEELKEDYLPEGLETPRMGKFFDLTVPKGYVFAMGDNRPYSKDCRMFGCVPVEKIESKVAMRFWPFNKFGKV